MKQVIISFLVLLNLIAYALPAAEPYINLKKTTGLWYQLASTPLTWQEHCLCTQVRYDLISSKKMDATYACWEQGWPKVNRAVLASQNEENTLIKLRFTRLPLGETMQIIYVDPGYRYLMLGDLDRKQLEIYSREPIVSKKVYDHLVHYAHVQYGYSRKALFWTAQSCGRTLRNVLNSQ